MLTKFWSYMPIFQKLANQVLVSPANISKISLERGPQGKWGPGHVHAHCAQNPFYSKDPFQRKLCLFQNLANQVLVLCANIPKLG